MGWLNLIFGDIDDVWLIFFISLAQNKLNLINYLTIINDYEALLIRGYGSFGS